MKRIYLVTPTTISGEISSRLDCEANHFQSSATKSTGIQTVHGLPYMLRVLPKVRDIVDEENSADPKKSSRLCRHLRFLGRLSLSQFGKQTIIYLFNYLIKKNIFEKKIINLVKEKLLFREK